MLDSRTARRPLTRVARLAVVAFGAVVTASIASLAAQSPFATLTGTVHDQLGGTIPKVTVRLTSAERDARYEVSSDTNGAFEFVGLPAGRYTIVLEAIGFRTHTDEALTIAAGGAVRRDTTLTVGTLHETIVTRDRQAPEAAASPRRQTTVPPSTCTAQPNSGGIKPPSKVQDVRVQYPDTMRGSRVDGSVDLRAVIGVNGAVRSIETVQATNAAFEQAAQDAVWQWRFTPTLLNCVPIEVEMLINTTFSPDDRPAATPR